MLGPERSGTLQHQPLASDLLHESSILRVHQLREQPLAHENSVALRRLKSKRTPDRSSSLHDTKFTRKTTKCRKVETSRQPPSLKKVALRKDARRKWGFAVPHYTFKVSPLHVYVAW